MTATSLFRPVDDLLRGRARSALTSAAIMVVAGMLYGAAMGSYAGDAPPRPLMMLFAALKLPLLLLVTFAISAPSWYVLHLLLGLGDDAFHAVRAVVASQATLTLVLASLSPLVFVWYASVADYSLAILYNGLMFAIASFSAQFALRASYAPLIRRDHRHRWTLRAWLVVYIFVGIQMAWVLRPFVGDPGTKVELFRAEAWDNAYIFLVRLIGARLGFAGR